jgi:hypothetical protein
MTTDNVIPLKPAEGNPEIIADFRTMLSDAQNARVVSYVTICIDHNGHLAASYFYDSNSHELALSYIVNAQRLNALTE